MLARLIAILFAVLTISSCKQIMQDNATPQDIVPATSTIKDTVTVSCSELSQSLVAGPFKAGTSPTELEQDKANHFKASFEIDNNPDNNNAKDTDIVVTSGKSEFRFLKTGKQTMIYAANLFTNSDVLENNCRIGMKRNDFVIQNRLQLPDSCNAVMVLSHDEALMITVAFKADTINRITAETLGE